MPEDYSTLTTTLSEQIRRQETYLSLLDEACRSRLYLAPQPTSKIYLFFHGFTAGPYQFAPMAEALFKQGHNVLVPLMPGHGRAGDWNKDNPPPLLTDSKGYRKFALRWLQLAGLMGDHHARHDDHGR